jgi:hypothetical protein
MLQAIGHLAVITAVAEELLHRIYWKHAGLNEETGPVVTDNINPKRLMEDIIKFVELKPSETKILADLKTIFKEFGDINTKRNHCLHWIWGVVENKPDRVEIGMGLPGYVSPRTYQVTRPIYRQSGVQIQPFDVGDVQKLCQATSWLVQRFKSHALNEGELLEKRRELEKLALHYEPPHSPFKTFADVIWPAPWLDKSSSPKLKS